jgi:hypothetical protein
LQLSDTKSLATVAEKALFVYTIISYVLLKYSNYLQKVKNL